MRGLMIIGVWLLAPIVLAADGWQLETASALWLPRDGHSATYFDNRVWILNGVGASTYPTDIWSSTDGVFWIEEVDSFPWGSRRFKATTVVFNGRIWMLGGRGTMYFNDVWSSPDGVNWTEEIPSAPWAGRYYHSVAVLNGRIWMTGGVNYSLGLVFNDLWSTPDGVNWTQEPNTPWPGRTALAMEEFNGRLWVLGTTDTFDPTSDV